MCCQGSQDPLDLRHFRARANGCVAHTWSRMYAPGRRSCRRHGVGRIARVADMKPNVDASREIVVHAIPLMQPFGLPPAFQTDRSAPAKVHKRLIVLNSPQEEFEERCPL